MSARPSPALSRARDMLSAQLSPQRRAGLEQLVEWGLPTPRDDAYRYTNLRLLDRRDLVTADAQDAAIAADLPIGDHRLVLVNGKRDHRLSRIPASCSLTTTSDMASLPGSSVEDRVRLLNATLGQEHTHIVVPRDTELSLDIVMIAQRGGAYPRISIQLQPFARVHLTEHHVADDTAESVTATVLDLVIGDNATLDHTLLQVSGHRSVVLDDVRAQVGRDGTYRHRAALLGAQLARVDLVVALAAPGATTELSGLFLTDGAREHHLRTVVHHQAPHCTSHQLYRGVGNERGRGSYDGKVVVDAGANGTNSTQSSKNLLLSNEASIETRPQLEINADAVKCSHGATTGSLDEKMMFYLLSRGLDRSTARAVLTYAFLGDVMVGFEATTRSFVEARALGRLPAADLIRGFVA